MNFPYSIYVLLPILNGFCSQVTSLEVPSKLLVVNGWTDHHEVPPTEVLDLTTPENSCQLPDFPEDLIWSVGGYTADGAVVCGGRNPSTYTESNECYQLTNSGHFNLSGTTLNRPRSLAGFVVTDNQQLWVLGGYNEGQARMDTELYGSQQSTDPLSLPMFGFCIIKINETTAVGKHRNCFFHSLSVSTCVPFYMQLLVVQMEHH